MNEDALRLLAHINAVQRAAAEAANKTYTDILESDIEFGVPVMYTGSDRLYDYETQVVITGTKHQGSVTIKYNRVDLAHQFEDVTPAVPFSSVETLEDLVSAMNSSYHTNYLADFFEDITITPADGETAAYIDLIAKENNYYALGQIRIYDGEVVTLDPPITSIYTKDEFNGFEYVAGVEDMDGKTLAQYLTYGTDYTAIADALAAVTDSSNIDEVLAAAISDHDTLPWVYVNGTQEYNLYGATLLYAGVTSGTMPDGVSTVNTSYTNVVIIGINIAYSTTPVGALYLHYNM